MAYRNLQVGNLKRMIISTRYEICSLAQQVSWKTYNEVIGGARSTHDSSGSDGDATGAQPEACLVYMDTKAEIEK